MNDWLTDWMTEWLTDWINDWLNEWMNDWKNIWREEWRGGGGGGGVGGGGGGGCGGGGGEKMELRGGLFMKKEKNFEKEKYENEINLRLKELDENKTKIETLCKENIKLKENKKDGNKIIYDYQKNATNNNSLSDWKKFRDTILFYVDELILEYDTDEEEKNIENIKDLLWPWGLMKRETLFWDNFFLCIENLENIKAFGLSQLFFEEEIMGGRISVEPNFNICFICGISV